MRKIVFDCETRNTFAEVGSSKVTALDLSLLVIYDYTTEKYTTFMQEDLPKLWKILEETDLLIGYNSDHFDIPLLNKYYPGDLSQIRSLDILTEIKESLGRRIRLDDVAAGTLGTGKTGSGLDAITWWRNGEIEKIAKYCTQDVKVTKEVYEYALENSKLRYKDLLGTQDFTIKTSHWHAPQAIEPLNYTLPF